MDYGRVLTTSELIEYIKNFNFTRDIRFLDYHNTWKPSFRSYYKALELYGEEKACRVIQDSMKTSHLKRGFDTIAQHLSLTPDGKWILGRDFNKIPASMKGFNYDNIMIECIGNFDKEEDGAYNNLGYDELEGVQKVSLYEFTIFFFDYFDIPFGDKTLRFHNEYTKYKSCPGTSISKTKTLTEIITFAQLNGIYIHGKPAKKYNLTNSKEDDMMGKSIENVKEEVKMYVSKYKNAKSEDARTVQVALKKLGYDIKVDGWVGTESDEAIRDFQSKHNLVVDGVVGSGTWGVIQDVLNKQIVELPEPIESIDSVCVKYSWNVRKNPIISDNKIGKIYENQKIRIIKTVIGDEWNGSTKWYKILLDHQTGYIHSDGVKLDSENEPKLVIIDGVKTQLIESNDFAIIKTTFDNLGHEIGNKPFSKYPQTIKWNWSLYNSNNKKSVVPLMWNGKIIKDNWDKNFKDDDGKIRKHKIGAIAELSNGKVIYGKVNRISTDFVSLIDGKKIDFSDIENLISGVTVGKYQDFNAEGFYGADQNVLRKSKHIGIIVTENNIYIYTNKKDMWRKDIIEVEEIIEYLGEKVLFNLSGDGGGSSQLQYLGRKWHTTSRSIFDILCCLEA